MAGSYEVTPAAEGKVALPKMIYYTNVVHHESYERISPLKPQNSAVGKNVIVTGGGTGIGKAIAIAFTQAGARSISILGRREDRLKAAVAELKAAKTNRDSTFHYETADLTKREDIDAALGSIASKVGKFDILVSNAAGFPAPGAVGTFETADFMRSFDMNVLSAYNGVQAFLPLAVAASTIINISTGVAHISPMPGVGAYGISKAAALKMFDYLATENPHLHIVNVQPGTVQTEMSTAVGVKGPDSADLPGHFCVWLASEEAKFLKSKFVWANWDVDELVAKRDEIVNSRLFTWGLNGVPM